LTFIVSIRITNSYKKKPENNLQFTLPSPVITPENEFLKAELDVTFGIPTLPLTEKRGSVGALSCAKEIKPLIINKYGKRDFTY
jgi:hypothetical protein